MAAGARLRFLPGVPANSVVALRTILRSREMGNVGYGRPVPAGVKSAPDPPGRPFRWWRGFGLGLRACEISHILPAPYAEQCSFHAHTIHGSNCCRRNGVRDRVHRKARPDASNRPRSVVKRSHGVLDA